MSNRSYNITKMAFVILAMLGLATPVVARAIAPSMQTSAGLSLLELKVTGDELVMLINNSDEVITDLGSYWLTSYNNVNPIAAGVASSVQQLPATTLQPHQTVLLSASPMETCGASIAGKLSVSLTDSGGLLQLSRVGLNASGGVQQAPVDVVSWSSGSAGIITNMPTAAKNPRAVYYRYLNGVSPAWQLADIDAMNSCQLRVMVTGGSEPSYAVTPLTLAAVSPPVTILESSAGGISGGGAIASNPGLIAPQISELLPNPLGTGNDAQQEYIELYNPNDAPYGLAGYILQVGLTKVKTYVFTEGEVLAPHAFKAFYPTQTKLSLSNTSSEVMLLDPIGRVLSDTGAYKTAKDGYAWVASPTGWRWSLQPTPNAQNVIKDPPVTSKKKTKAKTPTAKPTGLQTKGSTTTAAALAGEHTQPEGMVAGVHVGTLAMVVGGAVLYGAYEYRKDISHRLRKLAGKFAIRRANWKVFARR